MKLRVLPATAAGIVLFANAMGLGHAWRNRSGPVEAELTLTERELPVAFHANDEDSGVSLDLRWMDPSGSMFGRERPAPWLDEKKLQELGFDTSVAPPDAKAAGFYQRQRVRRAFVALEYDGPAWRQHVERMASAENAGLPKVNAPAHSHEGETHLLAIDAGPDAGALRARHPDRNAVLIVPAVVRIWVEKPAGNGGKPVRPQLSGMIEDVPVSIHVPRPFSAGFARRAGAQQPATYRIHLRYGASLEPWIAAIEFTPPATP